MDKLYDFRYAYRFNDKEIDQIVLLVKAWIDGLKIDLRHYTPQVRKYARDVYLLDRWNTLQEKWQFNHCFDAEWDTPTEVLWRMIKPMIIDHSGYSITKDRRWNNLNLDCIKSVPMDTDSSTVAAIERILLKLDFEGYINFQSAGSIWRIEIKADYAAEAAK